MDLRGKAALVTGGASGIGAEAARRLTAAGARVAVADLDEARTRALADEIGGLALPGDAAQPDTMTMAVDIAEDPTAKAVPYMLSGGTDAKSFDDLGIRCFGFAPLKLPPELDFAGMFHGVDERVPVDGLRFGVRVLDRFIDNC